MKVFFSTKNVFTDLTDFSASPKYAENTSAPESEKKEEPAALATALTSVVFEHPGGGSGEKKAC